MERKSKGAGYKMKGHTLPGINQNSEGQNLPDGRSKSSALQYRAPQANQTLVAGEKEAAKTSGGSVFTRAVQGMAQNFKDTKDMVKKAIVGSVIPGGGGE